MTGVIEVHWLSPGLPHPLHTLVNLDHLISVVDDPHGCKLYVRGFCLEVADTYEDIVAWIAAAEIEKTAEVSIVHCGECAKHEYCRTSNCWAVPPDDDWYCADGTKKYEPPHDG